MIIAITGPTLSGKDTTLNYYRKKWPSETKFFSSGDFCRERFGARALAEMEQPNAPKACEAVVQQELEGLVASNCGVDIVVAGMPRTPDQAVWMHGLARKYMHNLLMIFLQVTIEEQHRRMKVRDGGDRDALNLAEVRLGEDRWLHLETWSQLNKLDVPIICSVSPRDYEVDPIRSRDQGVA